MTSIYERLANARAEFQEVGNFSKVKTDGLKFAYLPIEQAKPIIEQVTAKNGITILPMSFEIIEGMTKREDRTNSYGNATSWLYMTANVRFRIASPEDSIDLDVMAEAQDNSDKCINKVYTMAYKNLVKIVFGFAESGKDDSKFDDARQQDNDFNQADAFFTNTPKTSKRPEYKTESKPKTEYKPVEDPEKKKYIDLLTEIIRTSPSDGDVIVSMLDNKRMVDHTTEELKTIYEAVHPFDNVKGGKA